MKPPIVYILLFLMAFLIVTVSIIFLNSQYTNIFKFDFASRANQIEKVAAVTLPQNQNLPATAPANIAIGTDTTAQLLNVVNGNDTIFKSIIKDSTLLDSLKELNRLLSQMNNRNVVVEQTQSASEQIRINEKEYQEWAKKTAALLEAMEPQRAAKILVNYSDNVASDLLFLMKKRKAAQILAELSPETATRITRHRE